MCRLLILTSFMYTELILFFIYLFVNWYTIFKHFIHKLQHIYMTKTPSVASSGTPMKATMGFVRTLDVYLVVYVAANVETPSFL